MDYSEVGELAGRFEVGVVLPILIGLYFGSGVNPRFSPILTSKQARKMFGDKSNFI